MNFSVHSTSCSVLQLLAMVVPRLPLVKLCAADNCLSWIREVSKRHFLLEGLERRDRVGKSHVYNKRRQMSRLMDQVGAGLVVLVSVLGRDCWWRW